MTIEPVDLKIEVGYKAYELYYNQKISCEHIQLYPESEKYRFGVYIEHIPSGKKVYENSERSQIKNRDIALMKLQELI